MSARKTRSRPYDRLVRARAFLSQLKKEQNPLRMKMLLLGYVTDRLEKKAEHVVLVGGQAVETYTGGQFLTGDVDITTTDSKTTEEILKGLGFKKISMIWLNEQLGIAIQIVGSILTGSLEKTRTIQTGPYNVKVIGVEDLIIDRLSHAKFWKSPGDLEKAKVLYANFKNQIDEGYLKETAKKSDVEDFLAEATVTDAIANLKDKRKSRYLGRKD